jgi:hypothetical protein
VELVGVAQRPASACDSPWGARHRCQIEFWLTQFMRAKLYRVTMTKSKPMRQQEISGARGPRNIFSTGAPPTAALADLCYVPSFYEEMRENSLKNTGP